MIAGREGERRLAILGGGSWGTALAIVLAPGFSEIRVWAHDPALVRDIVDRRENARYLPGIRIPEPVRFSHDPAWCLAGAALVLVAIPSAYLRETMGQVEDFIPPGIAVVSATKGLEPGSMLRMSQVIAQAAHLEPERVLALSGPSFAAEVARGMPAAVVVAGAYGPARAVQAALVRPSFRIYTSDDLVGVELGGALKNVIAIGAGMIAGLGLGHNAVAALVTRGLAEITRLAVCLGARPSTLAGLAGLGDLVLTCTGDLSRNRELGIVLGKLNPARNLLHLPCTTTEGVGAASVAVALAAVHGVEMPIAEQVQQVLEFGRSPHEAIRLLMERSLRGE